MHSVLAHLPSILATEKSKVAFYVAGGLLALWAVGVSVGLGLRMPDFPRGPRGQRAVMGVTAILVVAAMATAVLTAGVPASAGGFKGVAATRSAKTTGGSAAATGSAPAGGAKTSTLAVAADPGNQLRFTASTLKAPAGAVTITFTNMSQIPHNLTISQATTVLAATPTFQGAAKPLRLTIKPGTYVFYCSVPGHRQAGMQGTLTVN